MADATAAPTAPSGGAPAEAQPAPGPAPETQAAPATESRVKPIKSPPLPGVFPDDDLFPAPPSAPDAERPSAATPPRGPDGRFVAASAPSPVEGEHPRPQDEAPQPTKFKIAGEEYESQAAFEQQFKSLRGQFKPVQALARSLGGMEQVVPHFQRAAESARGWKAEAERLRAELEGRNASTPAQSQPPTPAESAAEADIDWELFAEVKKLATEAGEPWKADQWLIAQVRETERKRLDALVNERLAPFTQAQQKAGVVMQAAELFGNLRDYTLPDGSPAFPELSDGDTAAEIGRYWASLGLPMEHMLTPQAASAAIALYRMAQSFGSQAGSASPTPPVPTAPAAPTDTHSAATLTEGRPSVASVPGNGAAISPEAARIIAGLRNVNRGNRALLGFDA